MGINRITIACDVCEEIISLRVNVAIGKQQHHFNCLDCDSSLSYFYEMMPGMAPGGSQGFAGCKEVPLSMEARIINLHSDVPIPRGEVSNPQFSANIHLTQLAWDKLGDNIDGIVDSVMLASAWAEVKVYWDLYRNNKHELLAQKLNASSKEKSKEAFMQILSKFASLLHLENLPGIPQKKWIVSQAAFTFSVDSYSKGL